MENEYAIEIRHISKSFKVYSDKRHTIKDRVVFGGEKKCEKREVLKDISFTVRRGEAVGLIGQNGSGKSTLLKLLTKIMYPDSGTIKLQGRVSSLLELGAGFHPDMSGRENIYINASIFGLSRKEIDVRIKDIISFSELEEFIDNPVRTYSSGMYMRLAFAVAINVGADILLVDEVLAVGDVSFQAKCLNRLRKIKGNGTTIVLVSHSLSQIEQICDRTIWINNGVICKSGSPQEVHHDYMGFMGHLKHENIQIKKPPEEENAVIESEGEDASKLDVNESNSEKLVRIGRVRVFNSKGEEAKKFVTGDFLELRIEYEAQTERIDSSLLGLLIFRNDGIVCYGTNTQREHIGPLNLSRKGQISCRFEKMNLVSGQYWIDVAIRNWDMFAYDYCAKSCEFEVLSLNTEVGIARLDHKWDFG